MKTNNILCYKCRWGDAPGKVERCKCPDAPDPFTIIANAVVNESCLQFIPIKPNKA